MGEQDKQDMTELAALAAELARVQSRFGQLQQRLSRERADFQRQARAAFENELTQARARSEALQGQVIAVTDELGRTRTALMEARREMQAMRQEHLESSRELAARAQLAESKLTTELGRSHSALESSRLAAEKLSRNEAALHRLQAELSALQARSQQQCGELVALRSEVERGTRFLGDAREQDRKYREAWSGLSARAKELEMKLERSNAARFEAERKATEALERAARLERERDAAREERDSPPATQPQADPAVRRREAALLMSGLRELGPNHPSAPAMADRLDQLLEGL
jgi:chromosome segregation ATPase